MVTVVRQRETCVYSSTVIINVNKAEQHAAQPACVWQADASESGGLRTLTVMMKLFRMTPKNQKGETGRATGRVC